jgi:uncharacterized lipoprotein YmbA
MRPARLIARSAAIVLAVGLAACASAPTHFYTLQAGAAARVDAAAAPGFLIDVLPVAVPAQVDQPEMLIRESEQRVAVLDGERWVAPLSAELRDAVAADLAAVLGTRDVHGLAQPPQAAVYRIQVDVRRFDSWPGRHALIEADWSIRGSADRVFATCTSRASENVGPGYDALVQGHQHALARIADDVAAMLRGVATGAAPPCPQSAANATP